VHGLPRAGCAVARNDKAGCVTKNHKEAFCRGVLSIVLVLAVVSSLVGCKPTDFFTEVVITPFSDTIDYDNPTKTVVNSPDATKETSALTALAWTDESPRSVTIENLVTYSTEPTTTLTTHHSIYDLLPRFPGIQASDAVRLSFEPAAELDHESEADEQDESAADAASQSVGGNENQENSEMVSLEASSQDASSGEAASSDNAPGGDAAGEGEAGEEAGGSDEPGDEPGGNTPNQDTPGDGDGPGNNPDAPGEDPYGGYNGEVVVYNPNDGFARVNRVEHLAVLGGDVAVLAQSIGGAGGICAMNEYAYNGYNSQGQPTGTYARFFDVFSGELPADFEQSGLLWSGSGASPESVKDIDALVSLCGQGGVIVYDQGMGTAESLFDLDQRRRLQAAEIQLVPVDMSTVQGMLDAAQVIGEALSESSECAQDALAMAREYINTVNNIVRSVAATNGGSLATNNARGTTLLTSYNSPPIDSFRQTKIYGYIATDSESGLYFTPTSYLDASDIVLFGNNSSYMSTPLSFWMQTAGVYDNTALSGVPSTGLQVLWPSLGNHSLSAFGGGQSGGALTRWLSTPPSADSGGGVSFLGYWNLLEGEPQGLTTSRGYGWGLGSSQVPYLVVCASDGRSATQVKNVVVQSMRSYDQRGVLTPYSVLPYSRTMTGIPFVSVGDLSFASTIGSTWATTGESPFYLGLSVDDVVRENPTGLLGSWTEGNMESVLEAVWIADIYSRSPVGCDYVPLTNMSRFSVSIGGVNCTTTREAVLQFYTTFYRCDASGAYGAIVTDEGL
jgi:hypothetical protein